MTTEPRGLSEVAARWVVLAAFVLLVLVIGLGYYVRDLATQQDQIQADVAALKAFTAEVQAVSDDEAAENAAVAEAVRIVPEIKTILCEAFPDASPCLEG
jgi:hypothetical protein